MLAPARWRNSGLFNRGWLCRRLHRNHHGPQHPMRRQRHAHLAQPGQLGAEGLPQGFRVVRLRFQCLQAVWALSRVVASAWASRWSLRARMRLGVSARLGPRCAAGPKNWSYRANPASNYVPTVAACLGIPLFELLQQLGSSGGRRVCGPLKAAMPPRMLRAFKCSNRFAMPGMSAASGFGQPG